MKNIFRRFLSLLLVLCIAGALLPAIHAGAETGEDSTALTEEDYAAVNEVFARIDEMEDAPAKRNAAQTKLTDAAVQIVLESENYVEDSLERNGNTFTWMTDEGIACIYDPQMRAKREKIVIAEDTAANGVYNEPKATKGGWPTGNQVYLVGPYYGSDPSFTDQYKNEAAAVASAIGDTDGYTLYSGTAATIDKVAEAVSNGAVVFFDSHGSTDYSNPNDENDCVTGANYSYLCLSNNAGLTTEDYKDYAAVWSGEDAFVSGSVIANHMTKNSPGGLVWMAICLGMATDKLCQPMRNKGVEVVYGYSQSVYFDTDYMWETVFWDNMTDGMTVAASVADMKAQCGSWELSSEMYDYAGWASDEYGPVTMAEAREIYYAFPVVVSDEDAHPGQRSSTSYGACSLQTVKSTYTLFAPYEVSAQSSNPSHGTVSVSGNVITASPAEGYFAQGATVISGTATVTQNGNTFAVVAQSDCTVQINFAPKTAVTVSFSGANVASQSGYAGDPMNLPTAQAPEGYTFLGWMDTPLTEDTAEKPGYYTQSFVPTQSTTLYALYSYVDENVATGTGDYIKVTQTLADWSGEYVIVYEAEGYIFNSSLSQMDATSNYKTVTITDQTIAAEEADPYKFVIAPMDGGYSIQGVSGKYISGKSGSNTLVSNDSQQKNAITLDATGNANIISNTTYLRFNNTSGQYRFRYYKSTTYSSQQPIALYKKDGSAATTFYTGSVMGEPELVYGMDMLLSDDMKVNFHLNTRTDVVITVGDEEITYAAGELTETEDGKYVAAVHVAAAQMTDEIRVRAANEPEDPNGKVYTVRQYADAILANSAYANYHGIVREMLSYGAAAQEYFGYNTDAPANDGITDAGAVEIPASLQAQVGLSGAVSGASCDAVSLVHLDRIAVRFYFTGDVTGFTFTANGNACTPVHNGDEWYVEVADILPQDLDQSITLSVTDATGSELSVTYSPVTYIARMNTRGSAQLKALVKALYNYHLAAKALAQGSF